MTPIARYVVGRSLAYAATFAAVCAALIFIAFQLDGGSSEDGFTDSFVALAGAFGICFAGSFAVIAVSGGFHVRAARKRTAEPTESDISMSPERELRVPAGTQDAFRAVRATLRSMDGVRSVTSTGTSITAMRSAGDNTGYVQKILVDIAPQPDEKGAVILVRSRPRFRLTPFDMGRSARNVEELTALLTTSFERS